MIESNHVIEWYHLNELGSVVKEAGRLPKIGLLYFGKKVYLLNISGRKNLYSAKWHYIGFCVATAGAQKTWFLSPQNIEKILGMA